MVKFQPKTVIKTIKRPTPFAFPILVDRLRVMMMESLEECLAKMTVQYEKQLLKEAIECQL